MILVSEKLPSRQGFFKVTLKNGSVTIGQFTKRKKPSEHESAYMWVTFEAPEQFMDKVAIALTGDREVVSYDKVDQKAVDLFLARELSLAEKVKKAAQSRRSIRGYPHLENSEYDLSIPECRKLKVGDQVYIGALKNAEVVGLFDEGQIVVAKHDLVKSSSSASNMGLYSSPDDFYGDNNTVLWAGGWTDVYPKETTGSKSTKFATDFELFGHTRNSDISGLMHNVLHRGLVLNPIYQRDYVWSDTDKEKLLESIFESRAIGSFVMYARPSPDYRLEVIDGKQRLTTLLDFYTGKITYKGVYYHELSFEDSRHFDNFSIQILEINREVSQQYLIQVFLHVNQGGVPQEDKHLEKVKALLLKS